MSRMALELLKTVGLLDQRSRPADLTRFDDGQLRSILEYYTKKRREQAASEVEQNAMPESALAAYISKLSAANTARSLLPSFLVYSRVFTSDPLVADWGGEPQQSMVLKQAIGAKAPDSLNRDKIRRSLDYFSSLSEVMKEAILVCLPTDAPQVQEDGTPIYYSPDRFRAQVPSHIHDFVHRQAVVQPLVLDKQTGHLLVLEFSEGSAPRWDKHWFQ